MTKQDDFAPIPKCLTCTKTCKRYVASFLLHSFEDGTNDIFCPKYEKIKMEKETTKKKKGSVS